MSDETVKPLTAEQLKEAEDLPRELALAIRRMCSNPEISSVQSYAIAIMKNARLYISHVLAQQRLSTPPTEDAREAARRYLRGMFTHEPLESTVERCAAAFQSFRDAGQRTPGWNYDLERARDFTQIIYLAHDGRSKDPFYCGRADRHDPDEGVEGGWWDDSISDYVTPIAWMSYPLPSAQHVSPLVTAKMEKKG